VPCGNLNFAFIFLELGMELVKCFGECLRLVASILAEESGSLDGGVSTSNGGINSKNDVSASTSGAAFLTDDEDNENDEELILVNTFDYI